MAVVSSDPQVVLKKRKSSDRKRIEQLEARRIQLENRKRRHEAPKDKFIRAEALATRRKANDIEAKRINSILRHELKLLLTPKNVDERLMLVIRVENPNKSLEMSPKTKLAFQVLRLENPNTAVFVKLTPALQTVLKVLSPFIVVGTPSLASVRQLFQKRASVFVNEDGESKLVKLDNNQLVEDRFGGDLGFICIEDLVHEIMILGENFKEVAGWIAPFTLQTPVSGWDALAKYEKLKREESLKKPITLAGSAKLQEVDVDQVLLEQN